ncbi:MAG: arginine deiminase [Saccharofermentanales bacterium]
MSELRGVNIFSEIGRLRRVLLHRPGKELDNLTPSNMNRLLFDDIPEREAAAAEHDAFAEVFRSIGTEVVYFSDLLADILADGDVRKALINDFLAEARVHQCARPPMFEFLFNMDDMDDLASVLTAGLRTEDVSFNGDVFDELDRRKPLWFDPMPNLYFTRDPMTAVGRNLSLNCMWAETRRRESLLVSYVSKHHPMFEGLEHYYNRCEGATIEGGDILILSPTVVAVGISERTEVDAVKMFARRVLSGDDGFEHVLAFFIPEKRAFMHLDTVFTMVDRDIFTVHPEIEGPLEIYDITLFDGDLRAKNMGGELQDILKRYLNLSEVELIRCGGDSRIDAQREQWNDGSNTLAIAPGEVIVYERNYVTNRLLREAGVTLHEIPSSELSRGRGGPRCMSQPLWRDPVR